MLLESHKDTVAFSALMRSDYPQLFGELQAILESNGCEVLALTGTRDYWCRDFMPIQLGEGRFAQYRYAPDYLQGQRQYQTDPDKVVARLGLPMDISKQSLVADGGNFVFCHGAETDFIVMTDKVGCENPGCGWSEIEDMITGFYPAGSVRVVWLPWEHSDMCGHTDGILRYVGVASDGRPVVLTNLSLYEESHAKAMRDILREHFEVVELSLSRYDELSWAYINCLQTRSVIVVPGIGDAATDSEALRQIASLYPDYDGRVYQVQMRDFIAAGGGALNCCTWTISGGASITSQN